LKHHKEHPRAGLAPEPTDLCDLGVLESRFLAGPAPEDLAPVSFGTSGHRGSSLKDSFNRAHVLAIAQAISDYRTQQGLEGPVFVGKDSHFLSGLAEPLVVGLLCANGHQVMTQNGAGLSATPVISHAILTHNRHAGAKADGVILTPSHNPPQDGGIKYNGPDGGPSDAQATRWIADRANQLMNSADIERLSALAARTRNTPDARDLVLAYVQDLDRVINMAALKTAGLRLGVNPLGGAGLPVWQAIQQYWSLSIDLLESDVDPQFAMVPLDHDGQIRMDCSSPFVMHSSLDRVSGYDLVFANDPDADRHGVACPELGLVNPNHSLMLGAHYLFDHRPEWPANAGVGRTVVTSGLIDRMARAHNRPVTEVPVGFKWFVDGLFSGALGIAGEESAGASLLDRQGQPWTTDKDGIVLCLLMAEIQAVTGESLGERFDQLSHRIGRSLLKRVDSPAEPSLCQRISQPDAWQAFTATSLAGDPVRRVFSTLPDSDLAIGGVKVVTDNGWFAVRPSGTEPIFKLYLESFVDEAHLQQLQQEAEYWLKTLS
jgi:phosphoglucomutase